MTGWQTKAETLLLPCQTWKRHRCGRNVDGTSLEYLHRKFFYIVNKFNFQCRNVLYIGLIFFLPFGVSMYLVLQTSWGIEVGCVLTWKNKTSSKLKRTKHDVWGKRRMRSFSKLQHPSFPQLPSVLPWRKMIDQPVIIRRQQTAVSFFSPSIRRGIP